MVHLCLAVPLPLSFPNEMQYGSWRHSCCRAASQNNCSAVVGPKRQAFWTLPRLTIQNHNIQIYRAVDRTVKDPILVQRREQPNIQLKLHALLMRTEQYILFEQKHTVCFNDARQHLPPSARRLAVARAQ